MIAGKIILFDPAKRTGTIEDSKGQKHIIEPGSFRRSIKLKLGDPVQFATLNLYAGPSARDIEPIGASKGPAKLGSARAPHLPSQKFVR